MWPWLSVVVLAGCGLSKPKSDSAEAQRRAAPANCREALEQLAEDASSVSLDDLPGRLEGLCEDGPTQLLRYYARTERGEWEIEWDAASDDAVHAACPDWDESQRDFSNAYPWKLGERMWRRCDPLREYGVVEQASELGYHPTIIPWAFHAWMLREGLPSKQAIGVTRRLLALDRRTNVFTVAGITPPASLARLRGADWLEFGPGTIVRVNDRYAQVAGTDLGEPLLGGTYLQDELEGHQAGLRPWSPVFKVHPIVVGDLRGCERGWVAVDASLPYETLFYTVSSAVAACGTVQVLIELGEPGEWRIGAVMAELAEDQDASLPDDTPVDVSSGDRRVILRARGDVTTSEALAAVGPQCAMGNCWVRFALAK